MKSILGKKWKIQNTDAGATLLEKLLHNRNLRTEKEVEKFLNPSLERDMHDPFLMEDMEKAVRRVGEAIQKKERIIIFGDYDIDGITGTAILIHVLRKLGAEVSYRLPHRMEDGYGLREKFIKEFVEANVKLVITVDNGISAAREISLAAGHGIDVIVTDHHTLPKEMPGDAYAILHPKLPGTKYPFDELTGSAVAFKLAKALIRTFLPAERHDEEIMPLLDLAAMGIVSDMGPLVGENRALVKFGLEVLGNTRWPGLSKLKEKAGVVGVMSPRTVGFQIGPRINAAGRMEHAYYALQLLLDDGSKAEALAEKLEQLNKKRQKVTEEFFAQAKEKLRDQLERDEKILIVGDPKWHVGIVGLLAGKLAEQYNRPVLVMEERENVCVGSARSPAYFNVTAALTECSKYLTSFGGHAQAAGFEVPVINFEKFESMIRKISEKMTKGINMESALKLDCEILQSDISFDTTSMIENFSPFGHGNECPRFFMRGVKIQRITKIGKTHDHLKGTLVFEHATVDVVGFGMGNLLQKINAVENLDIAFELEVNEWNGRKTLQMKLLDLRPAN
ncbi:MAG: single-stranded-DNA-specific exonuclease RecJ [Patescibacteria group bacterium]